MPLFTLRRVPRGTPRKTRGRVVCYSFLVRLFHPLLHAGLSRRTANILFSTDGQGRIYSLAPDRKTTLFAELGDAEAVRLVKRGSD
ncbi:MAG: hypothetical protein WBW33_34080, partial [Bryobacteraceae bacterium]